MYAVQPAKAPQSPIPSRRPSSRPSSQQRNQQLIRVLTIETAVKLTIQLILSVYAISALWQIWPRYRNSAEKLSQIQSEVQLTQKRLDNQKSNFGRHFDPKQAQSIMQEHTNQLAPGQQQIIWLEDFSEEELSQAPQQ